MGRISDLGLAGLSHYSFSKLLVHLSNLSLYLMYPISSFLIGLYHLLISSIELQEFILFLCSNDNSKIHYLFGYLGHLFTIYLLFLVNHEIAYMFNIWGFLNPRFILFLNRLYHKCLMIITIFQSLMGVQDFFFSFELSVFFFSHNIENHGIFNISFRLLVFENVTHFQLPWWEQDASRGS